MTYQNTGYPPDGAPMVWGQTAGRWGWLNESIAAIGSYNPNATFLKPSGGDDTQMITNAISTAVAACQRRGDNYAEVWFAPGQYQIGAAPSAGNSGFCNAQIPIDPITVQLTAPPPINQSQQKVTLALRGISDDKKAYHWNQNVPQQSGACLVSSWYPYTTVVANNERSVVGGPTPLNYGVANFSNMHVVVDGVGISVINQPQIAGWDFRQMGEATCKSSSVLATSTGGAPTVPGLNLPQINDWAWGWAMPTANNNAICDVTYYACEGLVYGFIAYEHLWAGSMLLVNNYDGIIFWSTSGGPHGCICDYICAENNVHHVVLYGSNNHVEIRMLDIEGTLNNLTPIIVDSSTNGSEGTIVVHTDGTAAQLNANILNTAAMGPVLGPPSYVKVVNGQQGPGHQTSPTLPVSGASIKNPFWRDAAVTVTGGSLTGTIMVDGVATGQTVPGTVIVPAGKTIQLGTSYTGSPSWNWVTI